MQHPRVLKFCVASHSSPLHMASPYSEKDIKGCVLLEDGVNLRIHVHLLGVNRKVCTVVGMIMTGEDRSVYRCWNDTDRGRQKCVPSVEWYWQGKTEVCTVGGMILTGEDRSVYRRWNDTDRERQKCVPSVEWYWQGKTEVLGTKKPCPGATLSAENSRGLALD
jgi:hypothetical protein